MAPDVLHVAVLQTDPTLGPTDVNLTRASVLVDDLVDDAGDTLGPVSYTHLTLPTIYSV